MGVCVLGMLLLCHHVSLKILFSFSKGKTIIIVLVTKTALIATARHMDTARLAARGAVWHIVQC